jgi:uncharacterized damage-inducible protein DinB
MRIADMLLPELDRESGLTRLVLRCAPEAHAGFRPHPRSRTLGELCAHLAHLPAWAPRILSQSEFDLQPPDGSGVPTGTFESIQAARHAFDSNASDARAAIAAASDGELMAMWSLKKEGRTVFVLPRAAVLRTMVFNHAMHHRGQLTLYLRLCDVAVPAIYGPTADTSST